MKRTLMAAVAAFLLLFTLCMTAYAEPTPTPTPTPTINGSTTPTGTEATSTTTNPFTPAGTGTVTNYATGEDGKEFYTITAPDKMVFYLVIDRQRSAENVYFLNAVTVDDLMSLAQQPTTQNGGAVTKATPTPAPSETPAPVKQEPGNNNTGMMIIILVLAALGGGAAWYFKIYRPKQQGGSAEEYEPPVDGDEPDLDDWDEDSTDGDDNPPWDEDESEGDA